MLFYVFAIVVRFVCLFVSFLFNRSSLLCLFLQNFHFYHNQLAFPPYLRNSETISFLIGELL